MNTLLAMTVAKPFNFAPTSGPFAFACEQFGNSMQQPFFSDRNSVTNRLFMRPKRNPFVICRP